MNFIENLGKHELNNGLPVNPSRPDPGRREKS